MATVSAGLELMDRFTKPLQSVNKALQETVRNSERLHDAMSRGIKVNVNTAGAVREVEKIQKTVKQVEKGAELNVVVNANEAEKKIQKIQDKVKGMMNKSALNITGNTGQMESGFRRIAGYGSQIAQLQGKINNKIREGAAASSDFLSNIKGVAATLISIAGAQKLFSSTIGGAMEQKKMEDMFIARTGDAEVGTAMFDKFKSDALAAGQDVNKSLQSSLSFFSTTQNVDHLEKLNNLAQRMNAFDSAGNGIEGAAFALKEAMSGDIVSLAERFNMSKTDIRAFGIDELGKAGDMDGFIKAFDQLLEKQKMGQAAFETMMASPAKQLEILGNNTKSMFAEAGVAGMESLLPLITMMNEAFQAGTFEPFFSALSAGLDWVVQSAMYLLDIITTVYTFFSENWSWLGPLLTSIGEAILMVWGAIKLAAIAQAAWNAIMAANPIFLIITAITALVLWLYNLWRTNDAFAAGFMRVWNAILNFFDKVPIFFTKVGYGIANAFDWAKVKSLEILQDMANGAINIINNLIEKLNMIPGVSIELIDQVTFAAGAAAEAEARKQAREADIAGMEADANAKAMEREQSVIDMINQREQERKKAEEAANKDKPGKDQPFDFSEWNKNAGAGGAGGGSGKAAKAGKAGSGKKPNIGKVDKVGKIEKEVDISSEDLKTMRELAEMKNIQNFVTLTPTVQVNTGDINNGSDIDTIISRIETVLTEQVNTHAAGVYNGG